MPWQFPTRAFDTIIARVDELKKHGVVAISMGGDELQAKPQEVALTFTRARSVGLKTVCHAGETTDETLAREIVEALKPARITHAISIADWIVSLGPKAPPIDVCLTSNRRLNVIRTYADHPLARWIKAGVRLTVSTDDPAIFNTDLQKEYRIAEDIIPEFTSNYEMLKSQWLEAALDQEAAEKALHDFKS